MFNKLVVYEALKRSESPQPKKISSKQNEVVQDTLISLLIHDIFGGEILKTHIDKNWHFYNRINGERVDFTSDTREFEDIPSNPDEVDGYFDQADYSIFLTRFIRAFEETVGLEKYRTELSA